MNFFLAIDIGASSGRHMVGYIKDEKIKLEEIYRFKNEIKKINGSECWDIKYLFEEVKKGIKVCVEKGIKPETLSIDTWGVDFVLLDSQDNLIGEAVSYRDCRTNDIMGDVFKKISREEIYKKTGIQFLKFNTIFQLYSLKKNQPEILKKAKTFLMIPDYLNFLLTGKKNNEYTNATTTQLLNIENSDWDEKILFRLGIKREIFQKILMPKEVLGNLKKELSEEFGADIKIVIGASHDTGSAYIASPITNKSSVNISTGTWSLIGKESKESKADKKTLELNYSNEGGIDFNYRILKNIMGLWIIQEVKKNYADKYSFSELVELAKMSNGFNSKINVNDERFLKPKNMVEEIKKYCEETNQTIPKTVGEISDCVFKSLAESYKIAINELEGIFSEIFEEVILFGGGSQNEYLNQLVCNYTNKKVIAGPVEATAIGNIMTQMLSYKMIPSITEGRKMIKKSFEIKEYMPIR
ncbi:MAG: rhamnulokinase [Fusobacteriaceae bacterium]